MKGNLTKLEPDMLEYWSKIDLQQLLTRKLKNKGNFILHDGPPYANGHLHNGHALNKIIKDIVIRYKSMRGYNAPFVPGWDCHGLPIEWKIEEEYKAKGINKKDVSLLQFRQRCREFAAQWVDVHVTEAKRLGCSGQWDKPYLTMHKKSESVIAREINKFLLNGHLYRGFKPVMWSVIEKTALAEAEVEYKEHTSNSIYVKFPIVKTDAGNNDLIGAYAVIWTTTPWTMPANRAIAYGNDIDYKIIEVTQIATDALAAIGDRLLIAHELLPAFCAANHISEYNTIKEITGQQLQGVVCHHPLHSIGYDEFTVPLLPADHVSTDTGTGLVHTAPSHGVEDFAVGKQFDLEIPLTVDDGGVYNSNVPVFAGMHIFKADAVVIERLQECGHLLSSTKYNHSYPHSWRSKAPLIYRAVPQWFISMDKLRDVAMKEIENIKFFPANSRNRIRAMVENRPDWCLSRQRIWGVPIPVFMHKETGEVVKDAAVAQRIEDAFAQHGCDIWFDPDQDPRQFLGADYNHDDYIAVKDIVDVWFESGVTHEFVLKERADLSWPADLYLEGSDQHRGWFQSSLLTSCGNNGKAPYKAVLTHGFILDDKGQKMSKSAGNVLSPMELCNKMGAEILRLWVANCDFSVDMRIGNNILSHQQDIYRRLRNTLRYLLGAMANKNCQQIAHDNPMTYEQLPELEQWLLARLHDLHYEFINAMDDYAMHTVFSKIHDFCNSDLSAYYFDLRKDSLYCDNDNSLIKRSTYFVFQQTFNHLVRMLAPVLPFTAEEAWLEYQRNEYNCQEIEDLKNEDKSIHTQEFIKPEAQWQNDKLLSQFNDIRKYRSYITTALESARRDGIIGSSLDAEVTIYDPDKLMANNVDWCEQAIVSQLNIIHEQPNTPDTDCPITIVVDCAHTQKCARCWRKCASVGTHIPHPDLCDRCHDVVK